MARPHDPSRARVGSMTLALSGRAGLPDWQEYAHAVELVAEEAEVAAGERVLIVPAAQGALGVWAAHRAGAGSVIVVDTHLLALADAADTLRAHGAAGVRLLAGLPSDEDLRCDVALLLLPKGRDLARLWLLELHRALRPGGRLYLAGANRAGIKSAIRDAEALYGPAELLNYRGGNRVVLLHRRDDDGPLPEAYSVPGLMPGSYHAWHAEVAGHRYALRSRPGVFSWQGVDAGTRMLLAHLQVRATDRVLDVGCGYGLIGMHAARLASQGEATLVDEDLLACACARETLRANAVENARVVPGDGLAATAGERYTLITSNPPFHAGHAVSRQMAEALVRDAYEALEVGGRLVLVANRFLPYDRLMAATFGQATPLEATAQYHVLSSVKRRRPRSRGKPRRPSGPPRGEETIYQIGDD